MFANVVVANRGEIACRIFRTARRLGLKTIALHTPADRGALFTREADQAIEIGEGAAGYLDPEAILAAAKRAGAQCLHPGYGFLSENAEFAEACAKAGIVFVGPPPHAMRAMGLKSEAKAAMAKAGAPVVPGYHGAEQGAAFLKARAGEIGYPVLIKAIAGGGGRGMRRVDEPDAFEAALESAQREGKSAFGDARVLIEKYILSPRHIEVQVFGDSHGNVVHLRERDCSLQRRHQKVIEETPAPGLPEDTRAAMCAAAVTAAKTVGYVGAGTVEFIVDASRGLEGVRLVDAAHAAPAAAGDRLDEHGIADLVGFLLEELRALIVAVIARHDGGARLRHQRLGGTLEAHRAHRLGRRPDEDDSRSPASFGEIRVLAEEAVAGMQALRADPLGERDDAFRVEIALRAGADLVRLVGKPGETRAAIGWSRHRQRAHAHPPRRRDDAAGDFAAIGDEDIGKHWRVLLSRIVKAGSRAGRRPHIRNTPNFVGSIGAFRQAEKARLSARRVSAGVMIPSSHRRAVAK